MVIMTKYIQMHHSALSQLPQRGKVIVRDALLSAVLLYDWPHLGKVDVVNAGEQVVFDVLVHAAIYQTQQLPATVRISSYVSVQEGFIACLLLC